MKRLVFIIFIVFIFGCAQVHADKIRDLLDKLPFEVSGFAEIAEGIRTESDPNEKRSSLNEIRLQLDASFYTDIFEFKVKEDFYYDGVLGSWLGDNRTLDILFQFDMVNIDIGPLDAVGYMNGSEPALGSPIRDLNITLVFGGIESYFQLKDFLDSLNNVLPLLELKSFVYNPGADTYSLNLTTFYQ